MANRTRFEKLVALEPRLGELEKDIAAHAERNRKVPKYCANAWWYGYPHTNFEGFKATFIQLVGIMSQHPDQYLHTGEAYDIAYDYLYGLLPNCKRGCACSTFAHPGAENLVR